MDNKFNIDIKKYIDQKYGNVENERKKNMYDIFPVDTEQRRQTRELGIKVFQEFITENWDIVSKYIVWDSPETTFKHYELKDYVSLINTLKKKKVNCVKPVKQEKNPDYESIFKTFTNDELKMLCEPEVVEVIKYFKWYRKKHPNFSHVLVNDDKEEDEKYSNGHPYYTKRLSLSIRSKTLQVELSHNKEYDKKEKEELEMMLRAVNFIYDIFTYPDKRPDLVDLFINHLQYTPVTELNKLLEMIDKGFINKTAGRKPNDIPIYVFDEYGKLVTKYDNRAQCMTIEGIGKQYLSLLLAGKKRRRKCWYAEMTEEKYNELSNQLENMIIDKKGFIKKKDSL